MVSFEAVRDALLSPQPWTGMDHVVRSELAAGRLTHQIKDELLAMEEAVREIPGFSEQSEEAFLDTLDLLVGFCPAGREYQNPPVLPTATELDSLPKLARIAFAARCARRVSPLVPPNWSAEPAHHFAAGIKAVDRAERAAQGDEFTVDEINLLGLNEEAWRSAFQTIPNNGSTKNDVVTNSLRASASALFAVASPDHPLGVNEAMASADLAIAALVMLNRDYEPIDMQKGTESIRRDFDHLFDLSETYSWIDSTPVSPDVFGPMWTNGLPKGWPQDGLIWDFDFATSREPQSLIGTS
jgi:hypothetical protein